MMVVSIKDIPGGQFQEIVKNLRGKAIVKVPKKSLILRAVDAADGSELEKIKPSIKDSVAILFSNLDSFELASELIQNKRPAKAKPGQEAPEDIEIPEGPTDLVPGPAISELGALGIQIQIEKGKIHIKKAKVIAKKGDPIAKNAADLMSKLNIKPFSIGFIPLCAFDNQEKKLYTDINIDTEGTVEALKEAYSRALPFAVEIGFVNDETITFMLQKAAMQEKVLSALEGNSVSEEKAAEENKNEKPEAEKTEEKSEESKEENKSEEETQQENKSQEEK